MNSAPRPIRRETFGILPDGRTVERFTLTNKSGTAAGILSYGAILQSFQVADREGNLADVVLGRSGLSAYLDDRDYLGAVIGRYANRIANASVPLDGTTHALMANEGSNCLHGGQSGFSSRLWTARADDTGGVLTLSLRSEHGDQGFPGTLDVDVTYSLFDDDILRISFSARTSAPTVVNLSHHAYWNLAGEGTGSILDHALQIKAGHFTPTDARGIPTGTVQTVAGSALDFRLPALLATRLSTIAAPNGGGMPGLDHNFVLDTGGSITPAFAARLMHRRSGRCLVVRTTEPALQAYSGNFLHGSVAGKSGMPYGRWDGIALEPQHFPDSPHHPAFPSTLLRPGQTYSSTSEFCFTLFEESTN